MMEKYYFQLSMTVYYYGVVACVFCVLDFDKIFGSFVCLTCYFVFRTSVVKMAVWPMSVEALTKQS